MINAVMVRTPRMSSLLSGPFIVCNFVGFDKEIGNAINTPEGGINVSLRINQGEREMSRNRRHMLRKIAHNSMNRLWRMPLFSHQPRSHKKNLLLSIIRHNLGLYNLMSCSFRFNAAGSVIPFLSTLTFVKITFVSISITTHTLQQ